MNSTIERVDDALAGGPVVSMVKTNEAIVAALEGDPVVSMRLMTADEDVVFPDFSDGLKPELQTEIGRIYASLGTELGLIRDLVGTAKESLNVEDYGDALAGAFARLSVCIGCVEGLGRRQGVEEEVRHREDIEKLACIRENEWMREVLATRAGGAV